MLVFFLKGGVIMRRIIITSIIAALVAALASACEKTKTVVVVVTPTPGISRGNASPSPSESPIVSVPTQAAPPTIAQTLRTEKYVTVGSEIYEAALRDDAARVLQLCRQMDDALQQETDQRHDHDLLVDPCNLVVRGGSARSIKSQIAAMIPPAEANKQETVGAIDVQGDSDEAKAAYRIAYENCSYDPADAIRDSGTNSPEGAARWMSETWVVGARRDAGYEGCLDGLLGKPSKLGQ